MTIVSLTVSDFNLAKRSLRQMKQNPNEKSMRITKKGHKEMIVS